MAIKGLTDQRAAFPRIGKLRKGGPKKPKIDKETGTAELDKYGKPIMIQGDDLDHFRFDSSDVEATQAFHAAYRNTPRSINVRLPYATVDENFHTAMERYGGGGIEARCDREFMSGVRAANGKFMSCFPGKVPCQRDETKKDNGCGCKEVGRLNVIIPELQRFAYVTVETHSINDIVNLTQQLTAIEMTFGQLNGVPLVLTRRPEQISTPTQGGGRARREKWMLSIEVSPEWASRQIAARDSAALSAASIPQLPGQPLQLAPVPEPDFEAEMEPPPAPVIDDGAWRNSPEWIKISMAFQNLRDLDLLDAYRDRAIQRIQAGEFPPVAIQAVNRLCEMVISRAMDNRPLAQAAQTAPAIDVEVMPNA
jgi:hypothetical protein